jgi:hypothetical protein
MRGKPRLIFVCNAIDDRIRSERGITTDSPAGTRKVLLACQALRRAGVPSLVLSLGRGRSDGSGRVFPAALRRVSGVPVLYMPFTHRRWMSEIVSLVAPVFALARMASRREPKVVLFYNRMAAYMPALITARLLRLRTAFDLEDGEISATGLSGLLSRALRRVYDALCSRALLACTALVGMTRLKLKQTYYGTVDGSSGTRDWSVARLHVLLGGSLWTETGAPALVAAIVKLRLESPGWATALAFDITGQGPILPEFATLAAEAGSPEVRVWGRASEAEYRSIVHGAHVGLALKPNFGPLANTTFPSKVIEMAAAGLLVVTTDISDVRSVLGEGALYLDEDGPGPIVNALKSVVEDRQRAAGIAARGAERVRSQLSPERAGRLLADFLFGPA